MANTATCKDCKWWVPQYEQAYPGDPGWSGECRLVAPARGHFGTFPIVNHSKWCGELELASATKVERVK